MWLRSHSLSLGDPSLSLLDPATCDPAQHRRYEHSRCEQTSFQRNSRQHHISSKRRVVDELVMAEPHRQGG